MSSEVNAQQRQLVADRAYRVCEYCLLHEDDTFWGCQIDHIISRKHGGLSALENLAWACACCNNHKGSDIAALVGHPPRLSRLYHPRKDKWSDCFRLQGYRIEPNNTPGAATEMLLQFNQDTRLRERAPLAQTGRYPAIEALARMKE
jgi:hypothetical protein